MKKVASILAVAAFMFSMNVTAQQAPKAKSKKAKTETAADSNAPSAEKKSCTAGGSSKKGGCCAHKEEAKS